MDKSAPNLNFAIVVACDKKGAIGKNGSLPWHISDDLKFFKQITMGAVVVMGRKTFESIGRPLPGRVNVVLSSQVRPYNLPDVVIWIQNVEELFDWLIRHASEKNIFVIGGGAVYELLLPYTNQVYLTAVDTVVEHADTFFPMEKISDWNRVKIADFFPSDKNEFGATVYHFLKN